MVQNTDNYNKAKDSGKIDEKIEAAVDSISKGIEKFGDKVEDKINKFDEEEFEESLSKFFVKIGNGVATFFTTTIPKIGRKIKKLIESDSWETLAPFLFIIIALLIIVAIASGIRGLFT